MRSWAEGVITLGGVLSASRHAVLGNQRAAYPDLDSNASRSARSRTPCRRAAASRRTIVPVISGVRENEKTTSRIPAAAERATIAW